MDHLILVAEFDIFGQSFQWPDAFTVLLLVVLEGVLSIDNALVLGLLARKLPKQEQNRALTYGLVGAFVFRFLAIAVATFLFQWTWVKLLGGGYLVYIAVKHLFFEAKEQDADKIVISAEGQPELVDAATGGPLSEARQEIEIEERVPFYLSAAERKRLGLASFWPTVLVIELTDIAFAVDSILAAIALVTGSKHDQIETGFHPKLWVVIVGGILGLMMMRMAAVIFIKLLEKFPRFEQAAYLLVAVIGLKLLADWGFNKPGAEHPVLDFHSPTSPAFWVFWITMLLCFAIGFSRPRKSKGEAA